MTSVADFDFDLPPDLIAQEPRPRGTSRLLVVNRASGSWFERAVVDLPDLLDPGDCVVANDTRVFPARLLGRRDPSGGAAECFLVERRGEREWLALVHPGQKLKPGARLLFEDPMRAPGVRIRAEVKARHHFGRRLVELDVDGARSIDAAVDLLGHVPLPPYINRSDEPDDRERYQTVFARSRGSIAAPTAGLHFTDTIIDRVRAAGLDWVTLTHHVGYGTFKPVRVATVEGHTVDAESFEIGPATAEAVALAHQRDRRVVAIGTTTTRALESAATGAGGVRVGPGRTELFIHPGYQFRAVDALVTNFHLPRSSLLMLVSAFAGRDLVMAAYRHAIADRFRFYSYGDAMLVL